MRKIKETITVLAVGDIPSTVHINRKEKEPMPYDYFAAVIRCIIIIALIAALTVIIINVEIWKLLAIVGSVIVFALIYFGFRD